MISLVVSMMKVMMTTLMLVHMGCMSWDLDRLLGRDPPNRLVSTAGEFLRWMEKTEQSVNQAPQRKMKLARGLLKPIQCLLYHTIPG